MKFYCLIFFLGFFFCLWAGLNSDLARPFSSSDSWSQSWFWLVRMGTSGKRVPVGRCSDPRDLNSPSFLRTCSAISSISFTFSGCWAAMSFFSARSSVRLKSLGVVMAFCFFCAHHGICSMVRGRWIL